MKELEKLELENLKEKEKLELFQVEELESRLEMAKWFENLTINASCPQK